MKSFLSSRPPEAVSGTSLPLRLTAVLILITPISVWYVQALLIVLASLVLLYSPLLRAPIAWFLLFLLEALGVVRRWPGPDNHDYLLAYWLLAICIALYLSEPSRALGLAARWLLVAVFFWAAIWKGVVSQDYRDGRFYAVQLLNDTRFQDMTELIAGIPTRDILQSRAYLASPIADITEPTYTPTTADEAPPVLRVTRSFNSLVSALTWATLIVELAVALAFMLPWGRFSSPLRHGLLISFCLFTYIVVPIASFGWLLLIMGLAMVPHRQVVLRATYVVMCFLVTIFTHTPWEHKATGLRLFGIG